jgi:hypothetical protein
VEPAVPYKNSRQKHHYTPPLYFPPRGRGIVVYVELIKNDIYDAKSWNGGCALIENLNSYRQTDRKEKELKEAMLTDEN